MFLQDFPPLLVQISVDQHLNMKITTYNYVSTRFSAFVSKNVCRPTFEHENKLHFFITDTDECKLHFHFREFGFM